MHLLSFKRILVVVMLMLQCTAGSGQELKQDTMKAIQIHESNPRLHKLLEWVEKQTGFRFNYNLSNINPDRIFRISRSSTTLGCLLNLIASRYNVAFKFEDSRNIVFVKKPGGHMPVSYEQMGRVYDESRRPVSKVSIRVVGAAGSPHISGPDGSFSFTFNKRETFLELTRPGYQTVVVRPIRDEQLYVEMKRAHNQLAEVVVPGNIATTRRNNIATVGSVEGKDLPTGYNSNLATALQGKVPGLSITEASGSPFSVPKIQIRGQQSIGLQTGSGNLPPNNPLILVNGMIWATSNTAMNRLRSALGDPEIAGQQHGLSLLNSINQADIEKIEVYKDADATAIFGARGAHGVISIWTRKGDVGGALKYSARMMRGIAITSFQPEMMNTEQYASMRRDAIIAAGLPVNATTAPELYYWPLNRSTNWVKKMIGNTAQTQQYYFAASGGLTKQFSIYCSAGYQQETSVLPSKYSSQLGTFHVNTVYSPGNRSTSQFSLMISSMKNEQPATDEATLLKLAPHAPALRDAQGRYVFEENGLSFTNIEAQLMNRYEAKAFTLHASLNSEYALSKRIYFKVRAGLNNIQLNEKGIYPIAANPPKWGMKGTFETATSTYLSLTADPQLQYLDTSRPERKTISITAGATYQSRNDTWNSIHLTGFSNDNLMGQPDAAEETTRNGDELPYRYAGFYGAANLTLKERFIINLTGRYDGSSRLGPDNRWSTFGAIGTGWIFTNAKAAKDDTSYLSFGKLRASIGTTGNDNVGAASYRDKYRLQTDAIAYGGIIAISPVSLANRSLSWEQNLKKEVALDIQTRTGISMTIAWYHNITSHQLIAVNLPAQAGYTYLGGANHSAKVLNTGLEIWMDMYRKIGKRVKWNSELSLTIPRNRLQSFDHLETSLYNRSLVVGKSLTEQQAFIFSRVNPSTGLSEFVNIGGDSSITKPEDMVSIGNLDPVVYGGWTNKFIMRQWELSLFVEGRVQRNINPLLYGYVQQPGAEELGWLSNRSTAFADRWRQPGDISQNQKVSVSQDIRVLQATTQLMSSDKMLVDGSYLRLRYVNLSWTAPRHWISRFSLSSLKLYLRAQNIITITGYTDGDPTIQMPAAMPSLRSFLAGLELSI